MHHLLSKPIYTSSQLCVLDDARLVASLRQHVTQWEDSRRQKPDQSDLLENNWEMSH